MPLKPDGDVTAGGWKNETGGTTLYSSLNDVYTFSNDPIAILGSKLWAWYDPSDISTLYQSTDTSSPVTTTGQTVKRLEDKSGNARHLTNSGTGPLYDTAAFGVGKPGLNFGTASPTGYLKLDDPTVGGAGNQLGCAAVFIMTTANAYMSLVGWGNATTTAGSDAGTFLVRNNTADQLAGSKLGSLLTSVAVTRDVRKRAISKFDGTNHKLAIDSATFSTSDAASGAFISGTGAHLLYGADRAGGTNVANWAGWGGVLIVFNADLTGDEATAIDAYLAGWNA